jgi:hypothetical protein
MRTCERCGAELPQRKGPGRPRKFCAEDCRPKKPPHGAELIGKRFDRLEVLAYHNSARVAVRCDCGVEKEVPAADLRSGATRSCGCWRREHAKPPTIIKHGASGTPEYAAWSNARRRIVDPEHPAYKNYGGRGLTMAPEFLESFEAFFAEVGPRPGPEFSIDRIDNDKGYWPGNLRWATAKQQAQNRRCMKKPEPVPPAKPVKKSRLIPISETWAR